MQQNNFFSNNFLLAEQVLGTLFLTHPDTDSSMFHYGTIVDSYCCFSKVENVMGLVPKKGCDGAW